MLREDVLREGSTKCDILEGILCNALSLLLLLKVFRNSRRKDTSMAIIHPRVSLLILRCLKNEIKNITPSGKK
jgi:hypothetical protein